MFCGTKVIQRGKRTGGGACRVRREPRPNRGRKNQNAASK